MRWILFFTLSLCAIYEVACNWPAPEVNPSAHSSEWVRTTDGWEKPLHWYIETPSEARLHPLVVALLEVLTASIALVALSPDAKSVGECRVPQSAFGGEPTG